MSIEDRDPRIAILGSEVINQIAAGEVVERPASVVKELIENSLDAGATRIDVEIAGGGLKLIRVVDNGSGMTPTEAAMSLKRHATSKLRCIDDLSRIQTMGFRGEGLPSVAAVSRLTMQTRMAHHDAGYRLCTEGGADSQGEPLGCRIGTTIEVRDLFFNTPARLKFIKSVAAEAAHIHDLFSRLALAAPRVHFTLSLDERKSEDLPPCSTRVERARAVLGQRGERLFLATHKQDGLSLDICLGPPEQNYRTAQSTIVLVNQRYVKDRALVHAMINGYGDLLENGRFPVGVLYIDIDTEALDVNVHPQKLEVRFTDPHQIYSAIRNCVHQSLARTPQLNVQPSARVYSLKSKPISADEKQLRGQTAALRFWPTKLRSQYMPHMHHVTSQVSETTPSYPETAIGHSGNRLPPDLTEASVANHPCFFSRLRVVGQALKTFLVCQGDDSLILIDQHAAHERVTFERLKHVAQDGRIPSQRLLIPVQIQLEPSLDVVAREANDTLEKLGLELEHFGGNTWTLRAIPEVLKAANPEALVQDVLAEIAVQGQSDQVASAQDALLARLACHGSVRAGRIMEFQEIRALLTALDEVDFKAHCPHGRPVMIQWSRDELDKQFGR